ncbi:MAG: glycosyltransferase, partial [Raoultibacter sp.]
MRIFVASWFFPPATSSEGIVSYKLFRNSRHHYDVCSSLSTQWSYQQTLPLEADNINSFPIETDELEVWIEKAVEIFETQHAQTPYDAIMTRSMPPESILVAKKIRAAHPNIPWIASLGDPVAKEPYHIQGLVLESEILSDEEKEAFPVALKLGCGAWKNHECNEIRYMCNLKEVEDYALNNATGLGFPCDTLKNYVLSGRQRKNAFSVPHSFDRSLYRAPQTQKKDSRTTLAFLGHSDNIRSLEPIVRAAHHLKSRNEHGLDNLHIRLIGHVPENVRALVYNYYLHNTISIEPSVDYLTSLEVMQESDWLLHIDAKFDFLSETGNSIYFAGKLADYMGTDTPIFAITGRYSPADEIVRKAGGLCLDQDDIGGIAEAFDAIANRGIAPSIDRAYRDQYDAVTVAAACDDTIENIVFPQKTGFVRDFWPEISNPDFTADKLLTICVPSYKVECYLDRCLFSLITSDIANRLQIIVVNDGSPDSSREIGLAYQEHYPDIVKLVDKENGGHGSTINTALEHATGLYFRVLDGDDWIDGKNLTTLLETIENEKLYADLVSANYHQVFCEDGAMLPWMKKSDIEYNTIFDFAESGFTTEYFTIHSTMMKTDILKQANFKIQEHTYYVDVEYGLFPIPYIQTVMFAPEYVYRYA